MNVFPISCKFAKEEREIEMKILTNKSNHPHNEVCDTGNPTYGADEGEHKTVLGWLRQCQKEYDGEWEHDHFDDYVVRPIGIDLHVLIRLTVLVGSSTTF